MSRLDDVPVERTRLTAMGLTLGLDRTLSGLEAQQLAARPSYCYGCSNPALRPDTSSEYEDEQRQRREDERAKQLANRQARVQEARDRADAYAAKMAALAKQYEAEDEPPLAKVIPFPVRPAPAPEAKPDPDPEVRYGTWRYREHKPRNNSPIPDTWDEINDLLDE